MDVTPLGRMMMEILHSNVAAMSGSLDILMYLIEERKCSPACPGAMGEITITLCLFKEWESSHGEVPGGEAWM